MVNLQPLRSWRTEGSRAEITGQSNGGLTVPVLRRSSEKRRAYGGISEGINATPQSR